MWKQDSRSSGSSPMPKTTNQDAYQPSPIDVVVVKAMLTNGLKLPAELVLSVLDHAEYWPHLSTILDHPLVVPSANCEDKFVLRSKPLGLIRKVHYNEAYYTFTTAQPKPLSEEGDYSLEEFQRWIGGHTDTLEHPCRKIVFTIHSRDQGWGGNTQDRGTYRGSWTWFEAGLERFEKTFAHSENILEQSAEDEVLQNDGAATEQIGKTSTSGSKDKQQLSTPYFPVYAARCIRPVIEHDREAFHHNLHPVPDLTIQKNKCATRTPSIHKVVWSWKDKPNLLSSEELEILGRGPATANGDFVRNLRLGDVVTVWAKARFAGWVNYVESVRMDIYWAL